MPAVAVQRKAEVLEHLTQGKRLSDIAPLLGVGVTAISNALTGDPEYRSALRNGFSKRIDMAEDAISQAVDQVDVSRARAYWSAISWRAEREFPDSWGAKGTTINIGATNLAISGDVLGGLSEIIALANRTATMGDGVAEIPMKSVSDNDPSAT